MEKNNENSAYTVFHRGFRGYKKKEVDEYISHMNDERAQAEENYRARIDLLMRENEQSASLLRSLQEDKERLLSDSDEYKRQLKEQGETIQTLYDRLDLLGEETERLQNILAQIKRERGNEPTADEWKERAMVAKETVRRLAENELREDMEYDNTQHFRVPFGKKAYLDLTLRKNNKSV